MDQLPSQQNQPFAAAPMIVQVRRIVRPQKSPFYADISASLGVSSNLAAACTISELASAVFQSMRCLKAASFKLELKDQRVDFFPVADGPEPTRTAGEELAAMVGTISRVSLRNGEIPELKFRITMSQDVEDDEATTASTDMMLLTKREPPVVVATFDIVNQAQLSLA